MDTNIRGNENLSDQKNSAKNLSRTPNLENDPDYDPATSLGATINEGMAAPLLTRPESRIDDEETAGSALHARGGQAGLRDQGILGDLKGASQTDASFSSRSEGAPLSDHLPLAQIKAMEDVLVQIRENLFGPQQKELVQLLDKGMQMLTTELSGLTQGAKAQAASLQSSIKADPYTGIVTALRLGFALRQMYMSHQSSKVVSPVESDRGLAGDREDLH